MRVFMVAIVLGLAVFFAFGTAPNPQPDPGEPAGGSPVPPTPTPPSPTSPSPTSGLELEIINADDARGHIFIAVYDDANGWARDMDSHRTEHEFTQQAVPAVREGVTATFRLEPGTYAVSLFHDQNDDERIGLNFIDFPTESYGFSGNFDPVRNLGAPEFGDCQFDVVKGETTKLTIRLR